MRKEGGEPYSPLIFSNKRRPEREESSDEEDFSQEETRNTRSQVRGDRVQSDVGLNYHL